MRTRFLTHAVPLATCILTSWIAAAEPVRETQPLFNGRDLSNWEWVSDTPDSKMSDVWTLQEGILACSGKPRGYLRTRNDDYRDYLLTVEWRWPEEGSGGNNGVLVHTSTPGELGVWPKSIEVQLASGNAGDFWVIGTELDVPDEAVRKRGRRHLNLTDDAEKPFGEWNRMEITCRGNEVLVRVNGRLVNHATNCDVSAGAISLQSEGAPIEFRKVELQPLQP